MTLRKELGLSQSVLVFKNLNDLLGTLDEYAELHSNAVAMYDDRLGHLLRNSGLQGEKFAGSPDMIDSDDKKDKKQKVDKKKELEERGWLTLGSEEFAIKIATSSASLASNEVSALFRVVEQLKAKVVMINSARKLLSELPSKGFRADQKIRVVFRDGLPKQVIPTNEMEDQQPKFRYSEQFQIMPLK
ncbi:MAG: hypothetical protein JRN15_04035 [Nitrososphaerota archaeon]|nr:hypothetical protein [Nitrososphaerota archaeon]